MLRNDNRVSLGGSIIYYTYNPYVGEDHRGIPRYDYKPITYEEAQHRFIRDRKIRNLSKHTIQFYDRELSSIRTLLESQLVNTSPMTITSDVIKYHIILELMEDGISDVTINTRLRALRAFLNFLHDEDLIPNQHFKKVKLVKENRKIIETFSEKQVRTLISLPNTNTFEGTRDKCVIILLLDTGIRLREITETLVSSIKFDDGVLKVNGKGSKERLVPFQVQVRTSLKEYLRKRELVAYTDDLFVNDHGVPLTRSGIYKLIAKYGEMAQIKDVRVSPHTFRHTFAKFSVINGSDPFTLQHILGHTTMDMVRRYVNLYSKDVINKHKQFSPVTNLLKDE